MSKHCTYCGIESEDSCSHRYGGSASTASLRRCLRVPREPGHLPLIPIDAVSNNLQAAPPPPRRSAWE